LATAKPDIPGDVERSEIGCGPIVQCRKQAALWGRVALDEGFGLAHRREAMLGGAAVMVREDGHVGQLGARHARDTARGRAHVSAFIVAALFATLRHALRLICRSSLSTRSSPSSLSIAR